MKRTIALFILAFALLAATIHDARAAVRRAVTAGFSTATYAYGSDPLQNLVATWNPSIPGQPWVVLIHGGTWSAGDNVHYELGMSAMFQRYGWATFSLDYRLIPNVTGAEQEQDVEDAVTWVRAHWVGLHIDRTKGTLYGFSAGGHLAALTAYEHPGLVQDLVTASGAVEPRHLADDILGRNSAEPIDPTWGPYGLERMDQWVGCDYTQLVCSAGPWHDTFEPETFVTPSSVPTWSISGGDDVLIYPSMTQAFGAYVASQGVESHVTIAPGFGHTEDDILTVTTNAQNLLKFIISKVHAGSW